MTTEQLHDLAQKRLYKAQKKLKETKGKAEYRSGVTEKELQNIQIKLDIIDYLIVLVNRADPTAG